MSYANEVAADSPFAWWRLEETAGSTVADAGATYPGTVASGVNLDVAGEVGTGSAANFNGSTGRIDVGALGGFTTHMFAPDSTSTIEFWVKTTATGEQTVFGGQTADSSILGVRLNRGGSGRITLIHRSQTGALREHRTGTTAVNNGSWHHVAIVGTIRNADSVAIYLDGVDVTAATDAAAGGPATFTTSLDWGAFNNTGSRSSYFAGDLDELAVYTAGLSPTRIVAHYDAGLVNGGDPPPPATFTLGTSVVGSGSIALDPAGGTYDDGTVVAATATADAGWTFDAWSGDLTGATNPDNVTMDANKAIVATFTENDPPPAAGDHRWRFNEGTGTVITDDIGTDNGGLSDATTFWANTAQDGNPIGTFDGETVTFPTPFPTGPFTVGILVWLPRTVSGVRQNLITWRDTDGVGFEVYYSADGEWTFATHHDDGTIVTETIPVLAIEYWQHWTLIQVVSDGASSAVQVGYLETTGTLTAPGTPTANLTIGGSLEARVADVLFYDRALTKSERDDNAGTLAPRVRGTITATNTDAVIDKRVISLPSDGNSTRSSSRGIPDRMATAGDFIYVSDAPTATPGDIQVTWWRYGRADGRIAELPDVGQVATPHPIEEENDRHRMGSVGVDRDGHIHLGQHYRTGEWRMQRSTVPNDLTTLADVQTPRDFTTTFLYSYTNLFTDPRDGELYLTLQDRGNSDGLFLWRWDLNALAWVDVAPSARVLQNSNGGGAGRVYATQLHFSDSVWWLTAEWYAGVGGGSTGARHIVTGAVSTDNGATWQDPILGGTLTLPITRANGPILMPSSRPVLGRGDHQNIRSWLAADGVLHMVTNWANRFEGDTKRSAWYGRLDPSVGYPQWFRLLQHDGNDTGQMQVFEVDGILFVTAVTQHTNASNPAGLVYLWSSPDGGSTFTRHILDQQVGNYISHVSLDREGLYADRRLRALPSYDDEFTLAKVWEVDLPGIDYTVAEGLAAGVYWIDGDGLPQLIQLQG